MKILIFSNLYKPHARGGAERVAELQAEALKSAGHDVAVFTSGPNFDLREETSDGIKVARYFPWNLFWYKNINKYPFWLRIIWHAIDAVNLQALYVARKIINKEKPDLIITHNIKGMGMMALVALGNERGRWAHVAHDIQLSVPSGLMRRGEEAGQDRSIIRKCWEGFCRLMFNSPALVVAPSKWLLDFYKKRGFFPDSRTLVLPNPVREVKLRSAPGADKLRMIYIGQIEEHKGINWLVRHIGDLFGDWELMIVGDGSAMPDVRKIIGDNPRFKILGHQDHARIDELLAEADLTIVPSLVYENSPAVVYESLASGVPVLAARIGGVGELIEEGENGWTFEPLNSGELIDRLKELLKDPSELAGMAEACRASVNTDPAAYINQMLAAFK